MLSSPKRPIAKFFQTPALNQGSSSPSTPTAVHPRFFVRYIPSISRYRALNCATDRRRPGPLRNATFRTISKTLERPGQLDFLAPQFLYLTRGYPFSENHPVVLPSLPRSLIHDFPPVSASLVYILAQRDAMPYYFFSRVLFVPCALLDRRGQLTHDYTNYENLWCSYIYLR